ncbi:S1C family serine protease [Nitratiruptor tergarcus]|uniref:Serine protease, S1-C subfamily, contains C-terminal PDZ domain n=1 Tax=Nitratiruptor tergarcus DSM 16512 TaxID=1069081 RepID=A0A1W1WUH1_9BACT|nr:trypsin-like peptidase domain-containing protein [Nitratiruptor tergarcus]SMC09383.1 serine protease, S1-C subfamily, contains C-terminal PDZ domain [Nitratiruptor tergarcus DSM 16512]
MRRSLLTGIITGLVLFLLWQMFPFFEVLISSKPKPITPRGDLMALEKSNIKIFEQAKPSVVYISTLQKVIDYWNMSVLDVPRGTGSGFVWDEFGHIVTNYHVIEGASEAVVTLSNGLGYKAILVGADPSHDLAVLKIKPIPGVMKPVAIGDSDKLHVGQIVYAIGNPFGLDWTMTMGIISALGRVINEDSGAKIKGAIQTDAAINPGNSGGPLLDSAGRVIGVNTAIYSPSGANAGIGFAIPINLVNRVVSSLIAYGKYVPPRIGIESDDRINHLLHRRFGVNGVVVLAVEPQSPAATAGLKPTIIYPDGRIIFGDIIVAVDGKRVNSFKELQEILQEHNHGDEVTLTLLRDNREINIEITLE